MAEEIQSTKLNVTPVCPICSACLDGATGRGTPSTGDLSVCLYCAIPLRFDETLKLRRITKKEFKTFPADVVSELKKAQKIVLKLIEERKRKETGENKR